MIGLTLSHQKAFAATVVRKSAVCNGYWLETGAFGTNPNSIEQDPMHMASFYKESGN